MGKKFILTEVEEKDDKPGCLSWIVFLGVIVLVLYFVSKGCGSGKTKEEPKENKTEENYTKPNEKPITTTSKTNEKKYVPPSHSVESNIESSTNNQDAQSENESSQNNSSNSILNTNTNNHKVIEQKVSEKYTAPHV